MSGVRRSGVVPGWMSVLARTVVGVVLLAGIVAIGSPHAARVLAHAAGGVSGNVALRDAAAVGDMDRVRQAIAEGANLEAVDESGATPFLLAVQYGHVDVAKLLLKEGANRNAKGCVGWDAMHCAAVGNHPQMVRWVHELGFSVNMRDRYGITPMAACATANSECGETLATILSLGGDINAGDAKGNTVLMRMIGNPGGRSVAEFLLAAGADPEIRNVEGECALDVAVREKDVELTTLLLERSIGGDAPKGQAKQTGSRGGGQAG